jgi:peptidoglycan/LPS O-acetylase OafA/YrhL
MTAAIDSAGNHRVVDTHRPASRNSEFNAATHGLRGIASLMVFWAHLLGGTAEHIYSHNARYVDLIAEPWNVGIWGVELFFTISGFVILPSIMRYSLKDFGERRFFRLYPLFFTLSLIYVLLNLFFNVYPDSNNPLTVVSGFLFLNLLTYTEQLTPNAWSLTYEVMFYALAAFSYHFLFRKRSLLPAALFLLLSAAFVYRYPVALFFVGGMLIRIAYDAKITPPAYLVRACEIVLAAAWIYLAANYRTHFDRDFITTPHAWGLLTSTILYFYFAVHPQSISTAISRVRSIAYLGTVSYSLYLVHPYTYLAFRKIFVELGLFTENWSTSMLLFFAVTTPVTLVVTHFVHRYLEVGPYQWFFRERIYRASKANASPSESDIRASAETKVD